MKKRVHKLCHNAACFDTGRTQISVTFDDDDLLYVDFNNKTVVWQNRIPFYVHSLYTFNYSVNFQFQCRFHLEDWKRDDSVLIYPRDEVIEQMNNTLICYVRNIFPPTVKIKWTKNRETIKSDDDPFEKMIPGSDGMFQFFSRLGLVPRDGDIYSCIVEHETLKEPVVRYFGEATDIGPTVYCTICVTLGIIAFTAGIFIFCKDDQFQNV
uniref:Ig-like domain-containing protein n=1 Tax=Neogobius melanostomus TaxID=47308 RepID=A0A8C6TZB9_9GOBI